MASSSSFERTLAVQLRLVGNGLLNAPSSVDELLTLLDNAEDILVNMEQEPSEFLQDALLPVMKGLIAEVLFKHSTEDVRVTVASCLSEILRITSPEQPFNDDQMKAIFQLIVEALSKLSQLSPRCYEKGLSVLENIARARACLLMLELECYALVLQMWQHFWVFTRLNPSTDAYWAVEQIMADIISESEDISPDLLTALLASLLKETKKVAPSCWKLGEKLISNCAAKLRPIIKGAIQSKGTTLDDYSPVVALLYQNESTTEHNDTSGSPQQGMPEHYSFIRPKEGQTTKQPHKREISICSTDLSAMPTISIIKRRTTLKSNVEAMRREAALISIDPRDKMMKLPSKGGNNTSKGTSREFGVLADGLVGRRIKVWWPLDEKFYDGKIQSYHPITKKHKVLYDDGDNETLNLEKEWWEFIEDNRPDEHRQVAVNPKSITSPVILTKMNGKNRRFQSTRISNYKDYAKRAGAATGFQEVEKGPNSGNRNIGDESTEENVSEFRAWAKDVQLEDPSLSTSDDSTPEASLPRATRVGSKDSRLKNPGTSTSTDSTPEVSLLRYSRAKSKDVRLQRTSDDSTPEDSPPRYIRARSKAVRLQRTSDDSTPEASPPKYIRAKSKDVRLQSTSDDSTPEGSPPRPWGLWRSWRH